MRSVYKFLLIIFMLMQYAAGSSQTPVPVNGVLDLRTIREDQDFLMKLNGEWEFYWRQFVYPSQFKSQHPPEPTHFAHVPGYWTDYVKGSGKLPGTGYGTYRLIILFKPGINRTLAIDMPVFDASVRVFINGNEMYESGKPAVSADKAEAGYQPATLVFQVRSDSLEILLQVANFHHRRGGFWKPMKIGSPTIVIEAKQRYRLISSLSLGMLLSFSLFFLFFYLFQRKDRIILSFSLITAGVFLRMLCTDLYQINYILEISWQWMIRLEYLGTFFAFGSGLWYLYKLFPAKYMLWPTRINTFITAICVLIVLFFKVRVFAYTMFYFEPFVVLFMLYYLFDCVNRIVRGEIGKVVFLVVMLLFMGALINDILVANSVTSFAGRYLIHFALQLFVFAQAVMIIRSWIFAYKEREKLLDEIAYINKNLESLVDERTLEVNRRNREIQNQKEDIEKRNEDLKEALEFKNRMFSIIAHDLKSPVAGLVQNSALLDYDLSMEENKRLILSFRDLSNSALNLIDNLLYWGRSQGDQLVCNPDLVNLEQILRGVMGLFHQMAELKDVKLEFNDTVVPRVFADKELLEIIFRNLISNAIKFTRSGGTVAIHTSRAGTSVNICIQDSGVGIPSDRLEMIFENMEMVSTAGTNRERGTGLGLRLCRDLVQLNHGRIEISSEKDKGTRVCVILPAKQDLS